MQNIAIPVAGNGGDVFQAEVQFDPADRPPYQIGAGTMFAYQNTVGGQRVQGFAHRRTADAETLHQRVLARQPVTRLPLRTAEISA
ncbi:hypothetical protein SDC9_204788 [bioreactor metagenome]|uniref:Uncharacterized protein n=1 Tax=bioreactor metagenome TaxID=1076179 RepID=A0A645J9D5_9ZZZZ